MKKRLPLFPGYLFLAGERDDCFIADRTGRVAQVLEVVDQAVLAGELCAIHRALEVGASLTPCRPLERGMTVEVTAGPFRGLVGKISGIANDRRFVLGVDLVGKAAFLEIDEDLLRPYEDGHVLRG